MLDVQAQIANEIPLPVPGGFLLASPSPTAPRHIVPRRPLRLAPPRDEMAPDPRQSLVALNIFTDAFDTTPAPQPEAGIDPRILASRRRIRRRIAASADGLAPDEANFWHKDVEPDLSPQDSRHISAILPANSQPDLPLPLHEHLARVRTALYAAGPDSEAGRQSNPSPQIRLAACAMNATLLIVAMPVGVAVTAYSLVRGHDIRVSAQAMAVVASVLGIWQSGIERLL